MMEAAVLLKMPHFNNCCFYKLKSSFMQVKVLSDIRFVLFLIILGGMLGFTHADGVQEMDARPRQRALIIAVGNYPPVGGWAKLSSAQDAALLKEALAAQGFEDITMLVDKEATREGIDKAFDQFIKETQPGDIVYLHFSGHGQQVWDHDSDRFPDRRKDESDGYDESLVPYDARDEFRPGVYEGEKHLVDDELHLLLTELRQKIGPEGQLVFSVDACYSGSISRAGGLLPVRGTSKRFSPEGTAGVTQVNQAEESAFSEVFVAADESRLAGMVVFSAARADQPNYETLDESGAGVGSLSYASSRNLMRPYSSTPSFADFFRYVEAEMAKVAPYQSPQLEGDGEKNLFGEAITPTPGYPLLSFEDDRHCTVQGGQLAGLYAGTTVRLIRADGSQAEKKLTGKVTDSQVSSSKIELDEPLADPNPADWRMLAEDKLMVFSPVKIAVDVTDEQIRKAIETEAGASDRIAIVDEKAQLAIRQEPAALILSDINGKELGSFAVSGDGEKAVGELFRRIRKYTRAQYFRNFSTQAEAGQKSVEIMPVPVSIEQQGRKYVVKSMQESSLQAGTDVQSLELGTNFIFKISNHEAGNLYLNVIGVDAADEVFLLLPDANTPPAELVIAPDTTVYFSRPEFIFQISEPTGKQLFMVFATPNPVDLRPVFKQVEMGQAGAFRSSAEPQSRLLGELFFGNSRSGGLPGNTFSIGSVIVDIPEE